MAAAAIFNFADSIAMHDGYGPKWRGLSVLQLCWNFSNRLWDIDFPFSQNGGHRHLVFWKVAIFQHSVTLALRQTVTCSPRPPTLSATTWVVSVNTWQ